MMSHGHLYMEEKLEVLLEEFDEYLKWLMTANFLLMELVLD